MMTQCSKCGKSLDPDAVESCSRCGTRIDGVTGPEAERRFSRWPLWLLLFPISNFLSKMFETHDEQGPVPALEHLKEDERAELYRQAHAISAIDKLIEAKKIIIESDLRAGKITKEEAGKLTKNLALERNKRKNQIREALGLKSKTLAEDEENSRKAAEYIQAVLKERASGN